MMNYEVYELLKKGIKAKAFSDYEAMKAEDFCQKYEEYERKRAEKREAHNREMKNLMFSVLEKASKPLCPTDMQFILYRETGKEYPCASIAYYCNRLFWADKKLTYKRDKRRSYYSIKED